MKLWPAKQEGSVDSAVKKQSNFDAAQMLPNESMRQAEKWSGRANIVSNRPPKQRQAAMDYLSKIEPGRVSDKLESLVSDMASVTGITVSTDTMRRARQKREA